MHADSSNGSASPAPQLQGQQPPQHKRVYQACIPCRRRKVKCDLGSVDNPSDPPCVRCRRESKECYFSATRRKRKHEDGATDSVDGYDQDDYMVRNGRKGIQASPPVPGRQSSMGAPARAPVTYTNNSPTTAGPPLTPGGSIGRLQPLRRPNQFEDERNEEFGDGSNTQLDNPEAQEVMRREVYGKQISDFFLRRGREVVSRDNIHCSLICRDHS